MDKTLIISDTQSKLLLDFYLNKINEIDSIIAPYITQKTEFEDLVKQLRGNGSKPQATHDNIVVAGNLFGGANSNYNINWSIPRKGLFVLSTEHKDLSTSEIFEKLVTYEPGLREKRGIIMVLLSSGLKDKVGKITYRIGDIRDYKYGLLEWKQKKDS